ncbi:nuclear transport factor 2 family protein [Nocardioides stalactiti]|uniref:nuclear transport factor 2 family protein n=1 Tax=Nocardioides stalactiti TaxID=2755356 RepID=UPI001603CE03|nr:nuclear transport factor 2 family protein [Nocardioides stalactiti]
MSHHHDAQDIADVLVRYATGIDSRDWDLFRTVFTEDCTIDYGPVGRWNGIEELVAFMVEAHLGAGLTLHRITNVVAQVDGATGDTATATAYVDALLMNPEGTGGVQAAGSYEDRLVRTTTGWRISDRVFTPARFASV